MAASASKTVCVVPASLGKQLVGPEEQGKDPCAVARGRAGGSERGKARAEKLSAEERLASARKAVLARWNRPLHRRPSSS